MYVCTYSQEFATGGSPTDWYQAQFVPLKVNPEILSATDVKSNSYGGKYVESKTGSLKGALFKDGDNYYICTATDGGEWLQPPNESNIKTYPEQSGNAYWVKIELK